MKRKLDKRTKRARKAILATSILDYEFEVASHITKGATVYVKNTGVKASVEKIEKHSYERCNRATVNIELPVSKEVFLLLENYTAEIEETIRLNRLSNQAPTCRATIKLKNLSTTPYESKASQILHKKS
jgi:hypothetical protein